MAGNPQDPAPDDSSRRIRDGLSLMIAGGGFAVVIAIAITAIVIKPENINLVITAVLPLVATWVGTVIAYYFSKENLAAATRSMSTLSRGFDLQRLQSISVRQPMIARSSMIALPGALQPPNSWNDLDTTKLATLLTFLDGNKRAQRLPFLDGDKIVYLLHVSMVHKFFAHHAIQIANGAATKQLSDLTFADLLADPEVAAMAKSFALVSASATLADAKAAMDSTPHCEDVFVTQDGTPGSPVIGWVTDDVIMAAARV